jgi:uncharacterized RDD family membrane protein YckC
MFREFRLDWAFMFLVYINAYIGVHVHIPCPQVLKPDLFAANALIYREFNHKMTPLIFGMISQHYWAGASIGKMIFNKKILHLLLFTPCIKNTYNPI